MNQHVVYLGVGTNTQVSPGFFVDILACEVGTADCHPSSSSEVYKTQAIFIGNGMQAVPFKDGSEEIFCPYLRICDADDYWRICSKGHAAYPRRKGQPRFAPFSLHSYEREHCGVTSNGVVPFLDHSPRGI